MTSVGVAGRMSVRPEDYAFTIQIPDIKGPDTWFVYYVENEGTEGMMAFRQTEDKRFEIGFMRSGRHWTGEQIADQIRQGFQ